MDLRYDTICVNSQNIQNKIACCLWKHVLKAQEGYISNLRIRVLSGTGKRKLVREGYLPIHFMENESSGGIMTKSFC